MNTKNIKVPKNMQKRYELVKELKKLLKAGKLNVVLPEDDADYDQDVDLDLDDGVVNIFL